MTENNEELLISNSMDILSKLREDEKLVSVFFIDQIYSFRDRKLASYYINRILSMDQKFGRIKIAGIIDAIYEYQLCSSISEEVTENLIRLIEKYFYDNNEYDSGWLSKVLDIVLNSYSPRKLEMLFDILLVKIKRYPTIHFAKFSEKLLKTIVIERELSPIFEEKAKIYRLGIEKVIKAEKEYFIKLHLNKIIKELSMIGSKKIIDVFISYSHDNKKHIDKVISFTNHLRDMGYDAKCDYYLKQKGTAIDFDEMMVDQILNSHKVIVVLTEEYKRKADDRESSSVKKEMKIIKQELEKSENKIILVSFKSLKKYKTNDITPVWLASREVIDLKDDLENNLGLLNAKLKEVELLNFVDVNYSGTEIQSRKIEPFTLDDY